MFYVKLLTWDLPYDLGDGMAYEIKAVLSNEPTQHAFNTIEEAQSFIDWHNEVPHYPSLPAIVFDDEDNLEF